MGEKLSFIDLFGTELELEDEYAREQLSNESAARAEDVAVLEARMDTFTALPAGSTAGDAELTDIRVGADGTTYANAGDAVRGQIQTKMPFESRSVAGTDRIEQEINFPNIGWIDLRDGSIASNETAYRTSDFIDITNLSGIYRTGTTVMFTLWRYAFYDDSQNFISFVDDTTDYDIVEYEGKQVTWLDIDNTNAKYVRITIQPSRPYTYYTVKETTKYTYDLSKITIKGIEPLKFYGKKIVNFGDSIFGNFRDTNNTSDKSISKMIEEATGATCYNAGFGGCRMAVHSQYWKAFSMYSLAYAIANNDWTEQDAAIAANVSGMPAYFSETLAMLKDINFSDIDYVTIGYGTNDYSRDIFITGNEAQFQNETDYFIGALKYSIRTLLNAFPHLRIAVISPCWRWFLANGTYSYSSDDEQSKNSRNYMLTDYVDACKSVCDEYHIPYIDTYTTLGFNEYTHLQYFPENDGTHPNQLGRQLRADRIIGKMEELF